MAKIVRLIETDISIGQGVESDPCRLVRQWWTEEGELVATRDWWLDEQMVKLWRERQNAPRAPILEPTP